MQADTVRKGQPPGQRCNHRRDQEQERSRLKIEVHAFSGLRFYRLSLFGKVS